MLANLLNCPYWMKSEVIKIPKWVVFHISVAYMPSLTNFLLCAENSGVLLIFQIQIWLKCFFFSINTDEVLYSLRWRKYFNFWFSKNLAHILPKTSYDYKKDQFCSCRIVSISFSWKRLSESNSTNAPSHPPPHRFVFGLSSLENCK